MHYRFFNIQYVGLTSLLTGMLFSFLLGTFYYIELVVNVVFKFILYT